MADKEVKITKVIVDPGDTPPELVENNRYQAARIYAEAAKRNLENTSCSEEKETA